MKESKILRDIRIAIGSRPDCRIFRNNIALAVVGAVEWIKQPKTVRLESGDAIVRHARPLHAGLCVGSGDLIGFKAVLITPEMVGRTIPVFASLEAKDEDGRTTPEQRAWDEMLRRFGAISGVVRSVEDAVALVEAAA